MVMSSSNIQFKKIYDEFIAIRDLTTPFNPAVTENERILQLDFTGLDSKETLTELSRFELFEVYCGSDELRMAIKKLENPNTNFTIDDVQKLKFRIKHSKNMQKDYAEKLDYYFFLEDKAYDFLLKKNFTLEDKKISIGLYNIKSFNTSIFSFIDILNEAVTDLDSIIENETLTQIKRLFKNTDQKFTMHNNVLSYTIKNPNHDCPMQCKIIRMYYKAFFKLFSYKDENETFDIRGKKKIIISADENFSIENYAEFVNIINFLFSDDKFLEKYIIIKNVLTRYVHDRATFSNLDTKIIEIKKTSEHYFEKYVQEDLEDFFKSRDSVYKEALNTSKAINEQNDKVNSYINASLISFLILTMTFIFNNFMTFNLGKLIFTFVSLFVFSMFFYFYVYKSSIERYNTIEEQFDLFLDKMGIILITEKKDITKVYLEKPFADLKKSLTRVEFLMILLNVAFFVAILIKIYWNAFTK